MEESTTKRTLIVLVIIMLCCLLLAGLGVGGYVFYTLTGSLSPAGNDPTQELVRVPAASVPVDTLDALKQTIVPENDPRELACRLKGVCNVPETLDPPAGPRSVGDQDNFWILNSSTNEHANVTATLQYATDRSYFFVQDGVSFDMDEARQLVDTFDNEIYPKNREFFGEEWTPGIDGDPHIYILYARDLGGSVAGFFSSADETQPAIHEFSNGHEMFVFSADSVNLSSEFAYGVLAHEFQHMIHWHGDRNETVWINEGFSETAMLLNGYAVGGSDLVYTNDTDIQLNDWPNDGSAATTDFPHYGASFLFLNYFLNRFGEEATKALVREHANGLDGVDVALKNINATDPTTGQPILTEDLVIDWAVTNNLLDPTVGDGRFHYENYPDAFTANITESITDCPQAPLTRDVHQYGVDYIVFTCKGDHTINFTGSTTAKLLPVDAYSGVHAFWSNKGDSSDMTLTREFDLSNANGPIELKFKMWHDLETDYDYLYLLVSEDGEQWNIIQTPRGTGENKTGGAYGWGYNDKTREWVDETIDLSEYAGKKIFIRFEYVTDLAVNGEGFLLDDVQLDAINYSTDFETDNGGWDAQGFVLVENALPQTYRLALIKKGSSNTVEYITLDEEQSAQIPLSLASGEEAVLVITGTTRYTRSTAAYQIEVK